jgi:hypothetical protein
MSIITIVHTSQKEFPQYNRSIVESFSEGDPLNGNPYVSRHKADGTEI